MVKLSSVIDAAIVLVLLIGLSIYFPILPTGLLALSSLLTVIFIVSAAKGGLIPGPKGHIVMALVAAIVGVVFLVLGITQLMPWLYAAPAAGAFVAKAFNETYEVVTGEKSELKIPGGGDGKKSSQS